jgi:type I restriction enzyme S subunit
VNWPVVKLGEICRFEYGKSLPSGVREAGAVEVFGSNGVVGNHSANLSNGETVVVGRKGSVGEVNFSGSSCWPIDTTYYIDRTSTDQNLKWLYYALKGLNFRLLTKSTGVPGLNRSDAYELQVALPPKQEQKRIAAILDQADALRRLRARALHGLNTLGKAIFNEMFGDQAFRLGKLKVTNLEDCAEFFGGNTLPEGVPYCGQTDGFLILKVSDLNRPENYEEEAIATNKKRRLLRPAILDPNLMGVSPKTEVMEVGFLEAWFRTIDLASISSGSSVPQLNKKDLAPLEVLLPEIDLQRDFAKQSARLSEVMKLHKRAAGHTEVLFTSLQHRAFRGEL